MGWPLLDVEEEVVVWAVHLAIGADLSSLPLLSGNQTGITCLVETHGIGLGLAPALAERAASTHVSLEKQLVVTMFYFELSFQSGSREAGAVV